MVSTKAAFLALITAVSAHGTVSGIIANGQYHKGYNPSFQFSRPEPVVSSWRIPEDLDNGFIGTNRYTSPDIICHVGAMNPLGGPIPVQAGSEVQLQWTPWPESHHGPVIDYLARCDGACKAVDKNTLEFFKINQGGLNDGRQSPGQWASDDLIRNNNTWALRIPADIAPGEYVLRHEIIALHEGNRLGGAQNYPQCINIKVTGSGTAKPAGVKATALYTPNDAGIFFNIYRTMTSYSIPGPALYKSGSAPAPPPPVSSPSIPTPTAPAQGNQPVPNPTLKPASSTCSAQTVPVTTGGRTTVTVTAAGNGAPQATVTKTVTAAAATVTVTPGTKPMPADATIDDLLRWLGTKMQPAGQKRRSVKAFIA